MSQKIFQHKIYLLSLFTFFIFSSQVFGQEKLELRFPDRYQIESVNDGNENHTKMEVKKWIAKTNDLANQQLTITQNTYIGKPNITYDKFVASISKQADQKKNEIAVTLVDEKNRRKGPWKIFLVKEKNKSTSEPISNYLYLYVKGNENSYLTQVGPISANQESQLVDEWSKFLKKSTLHK